MRLWRRAHSTSRTDPHRILAGAFLVATTWVANASGVETLRVPVGRDTLAASVFPPAARGRVPVLLLLPGSERMSRAFYRPIAERFAAEGFVAVTFDRRGEGESSGTWDETKALEPIAEDGRAILHIVNRRADVDSTFQAVWGLSQGGWTGTIVAAREPAVRLLILVSDPALTLHEENLNERAWELREKGFTEPEVAEITDMRRLLWRYYGTGVRPTDLSTRWQAATQRPWFARLQWPTWEPTPDSLSAETLAHYRRNHDPLPFIQATRASVLRLYGREDHHIDSLASLAAARAAYRGTDCDTTFVLYANRGHILQSTIEHPECRSCPHDMAHFAAGFDFDAEVWRDIFAWVTPRLKNRQAASHR